MFPWLFYGEAFYQQEIHILYVFPRTNSKIILIPSKCARYQFTSPAASVLVGGDATIQYTYRMLGAEACPEISK